LIPQTIKGTFIHNKAMDFIKTNPQALDYFGKDVQYMTCTGKYYFWSKETKFDMIVFGTNNKGLAKIEATRAMSTGVWRLSGVTLISRKKNSIDLF